MPATAQNHGLTQRLNGLHRLNGLETVRLIRQPVPRTAGTVSLPAQPRIDPRRDALAAKIAVQLSAQSDPAKAPDMKSPSPVRSLFSNLFDIPTLMVSLAATGLLVGSAFATMMWTGVIDAPWSESSAPPEQRAAATVFSASAADAPLPTPQASAPPVRSVQTVTLPGPEQSTPEAVDALEEPDAADEGVGLFGDVRDVYRGDGQSGVPFGAVYDTQNPGPKVAAIPDEPAQAPVEEDAAAEAAAPQAGEAADETKWIELSVSVNLRKGPSTRAAVIGVMDKGTRLQEVERKRGWVKVIDPVTAETGWLYPNSIPRARRAKQPAPADDRSKSSAPTGPFATLGNWLSKP